MLFRYRIVLLGVQRETLANIMKLYNYEVLLLTETSVNTESIENWYGCTALLSTNVDAKVREQEEKKGKTDALREQMLTARATTESKPILKTRELE